MADKEDSVMALGPFDTIDPRFLAITDDVAEKASMPTMNHSRPSYESHRRGDSDMLPNSVPTPEVGTRTGFATGLYLLDYQSQADDSECSWDEDDDRGSWNANTQSTLRLLADTTDGFLLSDLLPKRQRRLVHAMATVLQLNHMTLGKDKRRAVLVSKQRISPKLNGQPRAKCWNRTALPGEDYDVILPERIGISGVHPQTTMERLLAEMAMQKLPAPVETTWSVDGNDRIACFDFDTAEDAAICYAAATSFSTIDQTKLKVTYRTAKTTQTIYDLAESPHSLMPSQSSSMHRISPKTPSDSQRGSEQFTSLETLSMYSSSKQSTQPSSIEPSGYTSGDSTTTMRSVYSGHSSLRPSRRRRLPASTAGYSCRAEDCSRTFNRAGDRTKHERIHYPDASSHPYECKHCSKTFMYPKDLRRHEAIHDRPEQTSASHPRAMPAGREAYFSWCMRVDKLTGGTCHTIFMDPEHERDHLRTCHGVGAETFTCPMCPSGGYNLRSDLLEHLYIEHAP